jgi:hypothetical protein
MSEVEDALVVGRGPEAQVATPRAIETAKSQFEALVTNARIDQIEQSVNELFRKVGRPGLSHYDGGDGTAERADAIGLCMTKHMLDRPKDDGVAPDYAPSSGEIDEALRCKKAIVKLFRTGELSPQPPACAATRTPRGAGSAFANASRPWEEMQRLRHT